MKRFNFSTLFFFVIIGSFAQPAKEYTQKGMEFYEKREYTEAILNFNKAIEFDPNYSQAYYVRDNPQILL